LEEKVPNIALNLYEWIQTAVSTVLIGILFFAFIGRPIGVDGLSMYPTLWHEDRVVMSNLLYTPKDGDGIILKARNFGETPFVKRVIAVAGQTIDIDFTTHEVTVDGKILDEPYINEPTREKLNFEGPVTIPEGFVFVMGDNRNDSTDSRDGRVGLIDTREILGRAYFVVIPGGASSEGRVWNRIGTI
jgi:signal peptidase I